MGRRLVVLACLSACVSASSPGAAAHARTAEAIDRGPLETGILDSAAFAQAEPNAAFAQAKATGAGLVRLTLVWSNIAPDGVTKPAGFEADNPADPHYRWSAFDRQVASAFANGFQVLVAVQGTPVWAARGTGSEPWTLPPDPAELAAFARAAATRYGGGFEALPRVRMWMVWNEPNLSVFLTPQFRGSDAVSPEAYRGMVNAFARAIHGVHAGNVVVAGGLAPYGHPLSARASFVGVSPLRFMRELLCMTGGASPRPSCGATAEFDVWSHHPYTAGGPTRQALARDDVSMGDLPEMRRLLEAAVKSRHAVTRQRMRFWVTEFSWDSNPPDPNGVPSKLHARWVAEAMYRMWQARVSLVTWYKLNDDPTTVSRFQSGLFRSPNKPKLALRAFRFPFVAFPSRGRVFVWGRTPLGAAGTVVVEQRIHGLWSRRATLRANRYGIFTARVPRSGSGNLRARLAGETSLEFSLTKPRDFPLATPFGD